MLAERINAFPTSERGKSPCPQKYDTLIKHFTHIFYIDQTYIFTKTIFFEAVFLSRSFFEGKNLYI